MPGFLPGQAAKVGSIEKPVCRVSEVTAPSPGFLAMGEFLSLME
ncbi:MAG: hypothetical protein ACI80V_002891 [Rhodothermales bacterium]|jgi:hypothetical protein